MSCHYGLFPIRLNLAVISAVKPGTSARNDWEMQYFVIWPDGQKFGPADVSKLSEWAAEGRITPDHDLESVVDGSRVKASAVPGIVFPGAAQPAPASPTFATPSAPVASADRYFVLGPGGQKFGPADAATLTQWAAEGRVTPTTELEQEMSGLRVFPSQVPGLVLPVAATGVAPGGVMPSTVVGGATPGPQGYSNYPRDTYVDPEAGKKEVTWGFICAVVGLCCCCFASIGGIVLGNQAKKLGNPTGQTVIIVNIVSLVLSLIAGVFNVMTNPQIQQLMNGGR